MRESFNLPRRLPWAVVAALVAQTGAGLMWAGAADQRLGDVERVVAAREGVGERLARVEAQTEAIRVQLERMEHKLDTLARP